MHPPFSPTSHPPPPPPPPPPHPPMSTNGRFEMVKCPFSSRHQASVEHRREMAPIPDTPQKPQSHPIIREAQDPTGEAEKDTLRLGNIVLLHHSVWQFFTI
ncbi:schlafen-like protein 1 [Lates japonicus]|uniref:Schlafen-like protein 1 n=1 Tax=Lates japonicus TaxID=270547 RepID=A0AAD3NK39_LATJO|nr:schlafen-like protein 1 [Lates japonicus]